MKSKMKFLFIVNVASLSLFHAQMTFGDTLENNVTQIQTNHDVSDFDIDGSDDIVDKSLTQKNLNLDAQSMKISKQILNLEEAQNEIKKYEKSMENLDIDVKKQLDQFAIKMQSINTQKKDLESKLSADAQKFFVEERRYKAKIALTSLDKTNNKLQNMKIIINEYKSFLDNLSIDVKQEIDNYRIKNAELNKQKLESLSTLSSKAKTTLKTQKKMMQTIVNKATNKKNSKNKLNKFKQHMQTKKNYNN